MPWTGRGGHRRAVAGIDGLWRTQMGRGREPDVSLQSNVRQGQYGEAFIYALACAAGLTVARMSLDVDGVDWMIAYPGPRGTTRSPKLEVQVKTWSKPRGDDHHWHYRLHTRHFNHLAGPGFQLPRYLALVIVPETADEWVGTSHEEFQLRRAAYWTSLVDQPMEPANTRNAQIRVPVPRKNLLTVQTLQSRPDRPDRRILTS